MYADFCYIPTDPDTVKSGGDNLEQLVHLVPEPTLDARRNVGSEVFETSIEIRTEHVGVEYRRLDLDSSDVCLNRTVTIQPDFKRRQFPRDHGVEFHRVAIECAKIDSPRSKFKLSLL